MDKEADDAARRHEKLKAFNSVVAAVKGRLVNVSASNEPKRVVVQKTGKAMDNHQKERVYRCGIRKAAPGPAVRAADAAGKPILPTRDSTPPLLLPLAGLPHLPLLLLLSLIHI